MLPYVVHNICKMKSIIHSVTHFPHFFVFPQERHIFFKGNNISSPKKVLLMRAALLDVHIPPITTPQKRFTIIAH